MRRKGVLLCSSSSPPHLLLSSGQERKEENKTTGGGGGAEVQWTSAARVEPQTELQKKCPNCLIATKTVWRQIQPLFLLPNQQHTLNKLSTELRCRNFVNKHRLSMQIGAKRAKKKTRTRRVPTELPFCTPPLVVGYAHWRSAVQHK